MEKDAKTKHRLRWDKILSDKRKARWEIIQGLERLRDREPEGAMKEIFKDEINKLTTKTK